MTTTIAHQIKVDYPGCHLTWCIATRYASVVLNNPDVDAVWSFSLQEGETITGAAWERCKIEANKRRIDGEFDRVFCTQIYPDNVARFDGTTRSSTFRNYPHPITVPITPRVYLQQEEISQVQKFAQKHQLSRFSQIILMECSPSSGQSSFNLEMGIQLAKRLTTNRKDRAIIISTHLPFIPPNDNIIAACDISYRENAALTHYCTFLIGCSSGITWIGTSTAAKQLNTVQFISRNIGSAFASLVYDFNYWQLPTSHIIESTETNLDRMELIVSAALENFGQAQEVYHEMLQPVFWGWLGYIDYQKGFSGIIMSYRTMFYYIQRNGIHLREIFNILSLLKALQGYYEKLKERFFLVFFLKKGVKNVR